MSAQDPTPAEASTDPLTSAQRHLDVLVNLFVNDGSLTGSERSLLVGDIKDAKAHLDELKRGLR
jgi:hypothetical protein